MLTKYYVCGNCGAPLDVSEGKAVVKCVYCSYVNETASIEDEMRRLMDDVRGWLSNIGVIGGAAVDAEMRALYFDDRIFPSLAVEFTNVVGDFVEPLNFPLLYTSFYDTVPDLQLDFKWDTRMGKPLQELAYKLSLPDVKSFATTPKSAEKLKALEFRAWTIPLLLNVLEFSMRNDADGYVMAMKNCERLKEKAEEIMNVSEGDKKIYHEILAERYNIATQYLKELAHKTVEKSTISEDSLKKTCGNLDELTNRLMKLKGAPRVDRIIVEEGLKKDEESYRTFSSLLHLNTLSEKPFNEFMKSFERLVKSTIINPREEVLNRMPEGLDISWFTETLELPKLSWFIETLKAILTKRSVKTYGLQEAENWADKNVKKPYRLYLYPFYIVKVATILKRGMLFWKKGEENAFYSLCDAAYNLSNQLFLEADYPSVLTPGFSKAINTKLGKEIENLKELPKKAPPKSVVIIPPTVTPSDAENLYQQAFTFREERLLLMKETGQTFKVPKSYGEKGFDPGKVKAIQPKTVELIHIPLAIGERKAALMGERFDLDQLPHRQKLAEEMQLLLEAL
nr:hypothetical protein [Candidatus Freyarchaeota archaeon]